jgi:hypothetical protein
LCRDAGWCRGGKQGNQHMEMARMVSDGRTCNPPLGALVATFHRSVASGDTEGYTATEQWWLLCGVQIRPSLSGGGRERDPFCILVAHVCCPLHRSPLLPTLTRVKPFLQGVSWEGRLRMWIFHLCRSQAAAWCNENIWATRRESIPYPSTAALTSLCPTATVKLADELFCKTPPQKPWRRSK